MKSKPLISIITVCYNSESTIKATIDSILGQQYSNYEYIIIDGDSKDKTIEIIESYKEKFNGKLKLISEKDNGIYDAMNKGIRLSEGEIIGIINSDDWYESDCLEVVANNYNRNNFDILYGSLRLIKNEKEYEVLNKNHEFIESRMITHPTCFIRKSIYEKYGLYNTKYKISADYEFFLRINSHFSLKYVKVYNILANFRLGGESSTENGVLETARIKKEYSLISRSRFFRIVFKSYIYIFFQKIKVKKGLK